jgi:hypothetical protein
MKKEKSKKENKKENEEKSKIESQTWHLFQSKRGLF